MNYYNDVYKKRINRYGTNFQGRMQGQREREFENKLMKSVYRVDFDYEDEVQPATLEPYKQDETRLMQHLLTRVGLELPNGTVLMIPDNKGEKQPWMVYWLESMQASGYNRYIVLKMSHFIHWKDEDGNSYESWAYMRGKQDSALKDYLAKISGSSLIYGENNIANTLIMPLNTHIKRDDYLEIGEGELKQAFRVTGYDIQSTKGVEFVTLDPVFIREDSPENDSDSPDEEYNWLNAGGNE